MSGSTRVRDSGGPTLTAIELRSLVRDLTEHGVSTDELERRAAVRVEALADADARVPAAGSPGW